MTIVMCTRINCKVYLAYLASCVSWPQDRVGLGLTLWPPWPHGAVGWTGEGAGPGDWGRGAAAQAGSVEVSAKDGGQE